MYVLLLALKLELFNNVVFFNRDRAKMFSEALSRFNKDFQNIISKKRSRAETFSNERSSFALNDRPVLGTSTGKVGVEGHAVTGGFEHDQPKLEERTKNVSNKRTRTSLVDVRVCVFVFFVLVCYYQHDIPFLFMPPNITYSVLCCSHVNKLWF